MRGLTWPVVAVVLIATSGMVTLYLFVEESDPIRGVIATGVSGALTAATVFFLGRRQDKTDERVAQLVETVAENGDHPPSDGRPGATRGR